MATAMKIAGQSVLPGEHKIVSLNIAKLPSNTSIDTEIHVFRSAKKGPVLLLMAGMHGDEVNGVDIVRRMIADRLATPEAGTIIAIPILNVYGFLNYSRLVPDGKDVNRSFPGNKNGSLASRVAFLFMQEIYPFFDYGIDFHTGGGNRYNYPQIRCLLDNKTNLRLATAFNAPITLNAPLRDRSLRREASRKGKSIIVFEGGESLRLSEESTKFGIQGARRVMKELGMISEADPPGKASTIVNKSSWIRAHKSGIFRSIVRPGQLIKKRQIIGNITDPFASFEVNVKSNYDGIVIGLTYDAVVGQGDALLHLGLLE
ncbi:MAG: succinylglutamate desuccinylase/aspartoacylase family protein [Calditrichaeota bacterium]|nr:succinylglutamate desuccinylase/aspartoacylase family protein [Calditrichota bacterium]